MRMRNDIKLALKQLGCTFSLRLRIDDSRNVICACVSFSDCFCILLHISPPFVLLSVLLSHVCKQCNENYACSKCHTMIAFYSSRSVGLDFMSKYPSIKNCWSSLVNILIKCSCYLYLLYLFIWLCISVSQCVLHLLLYFCGKYLVVKM